MVRRLIKKLTGGLGFGKKPKQQSRLQNPPVWDQIKNISEEYSKVLNDLTQIFSALEGSFLNNKLVERTPEAFRGDIEFFESSGNDYIASKSYDLSESQFYFDESNYSIEKINQEINGLVGLLRNLLEDENLNDFPELKEYIIELINKLGELKTKFQSTSTIFKQNSGEKMIPPSDRGKKLFLDYYINSEEELKLLSLIRETLQIVESITLLVKK